MMQQGVGACAAASGLRFWWETVEHPAPGELWELPGTATRGRASGILLGHLTWCCFSACSSSANSHYSGRVLAHHSPPHCTQGHRDLQKKSEQHLEKVILSK